jgi:hypothetical protein
MPRHASDPDHRCCAIAEPRPQSPRQQELVCLQLAHASCPRYLRGAMIAPPPARAGDLVARVPRATLAALLVLVLAAGASFGFVLQRGSLDIPAASTATPDATTAALPSATAAPAITPVPSPSASAVPTPQPTAAPTATPAPTPTPTQVPTVSPPPTSDRIDVGRMHARMQRSGSKWWEVGNFTVRWGPDTPPDPAQPGPPTQGDPDRCSPASTGTRWTTRDGSPSRRGSAPSWTRGRRLALDGHVPGDPHATGLGRPGGEGGGLPITDQASPPVPALRLRRGAETSSTGRGGSSCRPSS